MEAIEIVEVTRLPEEMADLVSESERGGYRFLRRLVEEWDSGANRFDGTGEALFGARLRGQLVGVCGVNVDPYLREESVGRVRHLYVLESWRRRGAGRLLIERVLAAARPRFRELRLRTDTPGAAAFYERMGFRPVLQESATHVWLFGSDSAA